MCSLCSENYGQNDTSVEQLFYWTQTEHCAWWWNWMKESFTWRYKQTFFLFEAIERFLFKRIQKSNVQYRSNVSWQSLEARYWKLDSRSPILKNLKDRGSSRVSRRLRPFENLSSRVSRLSSGKNKGLFARLTFDTTEYFFTGRSILISGLGCSKAG